MATIIETSHGFIAGDPPAELPEGHHWCSWCRGDGLDYDHAGELTICGGCSGSCTEECDDPACSDHSPAQL